MNRPGQSKFQSNDKDKKKSNNGPLWMRFLSYGVQLMATIGIGLFIGYKADRLFKISFPLLIWILPSLLLVYMLIKLVREFSKGSQQKDHDGKQAEAPKSDPDRVSDKNQEAGAGK